MSIVRDTLRLLLAAWLGASALFSLVVAPGAFAVLPSRSLAGLVVGTVLPTLFYSGAVLGIASLLSSRSVERAGRRLHVALAALVALACLIAQLGVGARIASLQASIGSSLDSLALADPRRVSFGRMHALSVSLLGVALVAAFALLVLETRATSRALAARSGRD
jgi:hypothetical protein